MTHPTTRHATTRLRIIVLGYIVRFPLGGMAWHYLQYVMGLARLGHDVYFVEDSDDYPSCYDPARHVTDTDPTYGLRFAGRVFEQMGLADKWAYHDAHTSRWHGPCAGGINDICGTADLLINVSGANPLRPSMLSVPHRVFLDTDPVFEQVRQLTVPSRKKRALEHTAYFSFGENIGSDRSAIPDDGLPWQPTRQPVVLDAWPVTPGSVGSRFTTIMQWDSYQTRVYDGIEYGMKSRSFEPYMDLPDKVGSTLELALGSPTAPRPLLRSNGWRLRDPLEVTIDCWTYQDYIQQSKGEFSVAKHGYVVGRSGWFSERSAAYLASGRPVVTQDTGISDWLQTGEGVIAFKTPQEAVDGIDRVNSRYEDHCRAARELAACFFDSNKVLTRLIDETMNAPVMNAS